MPKADVCFQLIGKTIPVDHGYALYSAISHVLSEIHQDETVGLKTIRGRYIGNGKIDISPMSELVLRLPVSRIGVYIPLAGKTLDIAGEKVRIGVLNTKALIPAAVLYSHLVTTKNGADQNRFEAEMFKQMETLDIHGKLAVGKRKTFQVHGKQVVGYSVLVSELTAEESIALQEIGLGGRRKMGCGFFEPARD